jgi:hypothetical protein
MEMILHGARIATNGDVCLMPTPEQWDLVATLKGAAEPGHLGRLGRRGGHGHPDVLPAQGLSGSCGP